MSRTVTFTLGTLGHFLVGVFCTAMFLARFAVSEPLHWYNWAFGAYGLWHLVYALWPRKKTS